MNAANTAANQPREAEMLVEVEKACRTDGVAIKIRVTRRL